MIQKIISTIILLFVANTMFAQITSTIIGKWKAEDQPDKGSEIYLAKDGLYYGKESNGKILLKKLKYDDATKTFKGIMTPPDKDIEFNVTISFINNNKLKIVAKKFFITKTMFLIRIN